MPNKIILKKSSVAAKVPLATDLEIGELAVNLTDKKLFTKDSGGTVVELGGGGASLPSQTGNSGKFLTTNGTAASWGDVAFSAVTGKPTTLSGYGITDATPSSHVGSGGTAHAAATTSVAGFMSSADKTKLDGIAANATANTGTVTSVGLSLPGQFTVSGSPVTTSGTLSASWNSQTANLVLAAPNGSAGAPTFRALVAADIPDLTLEKVPDAWVKRAVRCATTANITLSGTQTIDGVAVVAGDRVLVKDQTSAATNGIYVVAAGAWTRAADADTASELSAASVAVDSGTTNGGYSFDTDFRATDTLGTTAMSWSRIVDTGLASSTTPSAPGTAAVGTSLNYARADHTHAAQTITLTGDVTGSGTGSFAATLANSGVTAGTYRSVTVDAKGRVTGGTNPTTLAGYGITDAVTAGAGGAIIENAQTISANYTLTAGRNGMSAGTITINSGVTVTIPSGASWAIV